MSGQQVLKVDCETLLAKKEQITADWPEVPPPPQAPSNLAVAKKAVRQILGPRNAFVTALTAGKAQAERLGACLEATANAYRTVDEIKAAALREGRAPAVETVVPVAPEFGPAPPLTEGTTPLEPAPDTTGFPDWTVAYAEITSGDQGSSLHEFARGMYELSDKLTERAKAFSLADTHWEGEAAEAAEARLREHESWLYDLAKDARDLAAQAQQLAEIQVSERPRHPDQDDI